MSYQVGNIEVALTTKMDEVDKKTNKVIASLKGLKRGISDNRKEIERTSKSAKSLDKNLNTAFNVGKLYVALNYVRRYSQAIGNTVKSSIDYVETVNKFKVSMNGMYKDAIKYQNKINENFGLSKSILMDYQANFNNILKGLGGISDKTAYALSETLTEMSIDFSSLFNVSIERATSALQAALTQQVRPIRSVSGFDTTEKSLQNTLKQIGINDRRISQLSQIEKRLLVIITLQRQMQIVNAESDFSRTIEQPANQLKILTHTLKDLSIAFGNFILHGLTPAFKYINGFLMAVKAVIQTLSVLRFGDIAEENKPLDLETMLQPEKAATGVEKVKKSVKDLKNATLGIDELNIISPPSDTSGGETDGGGDLGGVDPRLLEYLGEYNSKLEETKMKATKIRNRIMEWLGFTKLVDEETGQTTWKLGEGYTRLELIRDIIKAIFGMIAFHIGKKLVLKAIMSVVKFVSGIKNLTGLGLISKIGQVIALVKGGAGTVREAIGTIFPVIGTLDKLLTNLFTRILYSNFGTTILKSFHVISAGFTTLASTIGVSVGGLIAIIAGVVAAIIGVVYAVKHWDEIKEYLSTFGEWIKEKWKELKAWFLEKWEGVKTWFKNLPHNLGVALGKLIGTLENWAKDVGNWFTEKWNALSTWFTEKWKSIKNWFTERLPEIIENIVQWFKDLPGRIFDALMGLKEKIGIWATNVKTWFTERLPEILTTVVEWFKKLPQKIVTVGRNIVIGLWNGIVDKWEWLKNKFHSILGWFKDASNEFKSGYKEGYESVTGYATGGFPTRGDYFLANENGVPEYVGSMGGKTAVANTHQIVEGISIGVSKANTETNILLRNLERIGTQLLAKDTDVYMDGRKVSEGIRQAQDGMGYNAVVGGWSYV